ncbi:hypothetical protein ACWDTP_04680 [Mycobacterium sp. NPDC003449]
MEYLVTTPTGTYRIEQSAPEVDDVIAMLDWLVEKHAITGPGPLAVHSRQQVLAALGRPTIPDDKNNPFPEPDVIVGEEAAGAFTRGWLEWRAQDWLDGKYRKAAAALGDVDTDLPEAEATPAEAADDSGNDTTPADGEGPPSNAPVPTQSDDPAAWVKGRRVWEAPGAADERVVIMSSRGVAVPSGWVLTRHLPEARNIPRFLNWHWRKPPANGLPQIWFTAEAMDAIGIAVEDADPDEVKEIVAEHFGCRVSWAQSGFFTCRWGTGTNADSDVDEDNENGASAPTRRSAQLVFVPWLPLDPADARPNDLGVAGTLDTDTELPEDEDEAVPILAERIAWIAGLGQGVAPASRWSTVGAAFADVKRRGSTIKNVKGCPLPGEVQATQSDLDPDLHISKRPHKARGEHRKVETDQRSAYLASAITGEFGYGDPTRVEHPEPEMFNAQNPPFALCRVTTPAGDKIDGLDRRLPLPIEYMAWDEPRTFWTTTRGVRHLISPTDLGGAGLAPVELGIDAAWVWPHQSRLLRSWADAIRKRLIEAIAEGRKDREDMLKAVYKAYLGRMRSAKWSPQQYHHHQPVWFAAITADTRARAMAFAVNIAQTHNLYPVAADVDAWMYWLPPEIDPSVLAEESTANGKYRIKAIEETTTGEQP